MSKPTSKIYYYQFLLFNAISNFESSEKKLLEWIENNKNLCPFEHLFLKFNINLTNFKIFMEITKKDDSYIYQSNNFTQKEVLDLLPNCSSANIDDERDRIFNSKLISV